MMLMWSTQRVLMFMFVSGCVHACAFAYMCPRVFLCVSTNVTKSLGTLIGQFGSLLRPIASIHQRGRDGENT